MSRSTNVGSSEGRAGSPKVGNARAEGAAHAHAPLHLADPASTPELGLRPSRAWWRQPHWQTWLRRLAVAWALTAIGAIPYPRYVTEPCAILPARRLELRARAEGVLTEAMVDEGSLVQPGDVLARLEDHELDAQLHRALAEVDRLAALTAKLRAGARTEEIARSEALVDARSQSLKLADRALERQTVLAGKHLVGSDDLERAQRERAQNAGDLGLARAELRLLRAGTRPEELRAIEADLQRAQVELEDLERKQQLLAIVSPIAGVVVTPRFRESLHKRFVLGATVCQVSDLRRARVEVYIPEREFDVLAVGQPTTVKVQSFPLHPFHGKLAFLAHAVEQHGGVGVVRALTEVDNASGLLRENMTGYAEVNTGKTRLAVLAVRRLVRWIRLRFLI